MKHADAIAAEFVGTGLLLMIVVGSGIMGEQLAGGNAAIALLGNSIATGAGLYVLISALGSISGAHFNPVVTLMFWRSGHVPAGLAAKFISAQFLGGVLGVCVTHAMFALPIIQASAKARTGFAQWLSELIATLILLLTVRFGVKQAPEKVPMMVALIVTAGYWFTASTFFANPAVTLARSLTDTFAGIAPAHVFGFIVAQVLAVLSVVMAVRAKL